MNKHGRQPNKDILIPLRCGARSKRAPGIRWRVWKREEEKRKSREDVESGLEANLGESDILLKKPIYRLHIAECRLFG
jgi:hypothetical protein